MAIKRPTLVRVAGRRIKVVYETAQMNLDYQGLHKGWKNLILLDPSQAPDELRATALHELVHDVEQTSCCKMTERDVTAFSSIMFAVIRDNPAFFAWLQEKK